jgi:glycosyltransferase involved in cell wall biosynthesis
MQQVFLISTPTIEAWSYGSPDGAGIGGSETAHIELAWRLAKRGYDATSFVPGQQECDEVWRNVLWQNYTKADYSKPGVWFIYRDPSVLDHFSAHHPGQTLIFIAQDVSYKLATKERLLKLDKYVCLCQDHASFIAHEWPCIKDRIVISGNGLKPELVDQTIKMDIERNPLRLMYASSPDRGLKNLALVFKRAKEYVPDLELHVYYGFDNIDKIIAGLTKSKAFYIKQERENIMRVIENVPGLYLEGRVPQTKLYQEWARAGIWCHPSSFSETNCITASEAMAMGAVPITNPIWAVKDKVKHGILIEGNPDVDPLVRNRYVGEVLRLTSDSGIKLQEKIRPEMMAWAKHEFSWEKIVSQMESWIEASVEQGELSHVNG